MRSIPPYRLWLGHAGDARDLRRVLAEGVVALVDLAVNEAPVAAPRELVYCRFPLADGAGNSRWILRAAVEATAHLLRAAAPTLVFCGAGMSRSPAVAAAALSLATGQAPEECLRQVSDGAVDVSPGLWREVRELLSEPGEGFAKYTSP